MARDCIKTKFNNCSTEIQIRSCKKGTNADWGKFTPSAELSAEASRSLNYRDPTYTAAGSNSANAAISAVLNGILSMVVVTMLPQNRKTH